MQKEKNGKGSDEANKEVVKERRGRGKEDEL